ncbi:MAG: DUF1573 domain-containing protein [Bacteroidia bacterium]|nr:DUF1573 domain-containing protein [Bacteroidia bacterium]
MRKKLSIYVIILILSAAGCTGRNGKGNGSVNTQPGDTGKPVITFTEIEHDFGMVNEGEKVGCIFSFKNTGTANLIINSATTSCGCTVPKYDRKPISPDSGGTIEVVFDTSGRNGKQTKTITVQSNAATPVLLLQIKAEVINNN